MTRHRHTAYLTAACVAAPDCRDPPRPGGLTAPRPISGDDTGGAPPVPIPNTAVKPARPMIVRQRESRSSPDPSNQGPPPPRGGGGPFFGGFWISLDQIFLAISIQRDFPRKLPASCISH